MRKLAVIVFASVVFVFNPAFLSGVTDDGPFRYSAKELNAALAGTWTVTIHHTPPIAVTFRIEQAKTDPRARAPHAPGFISDAAACASRSLVASAGACADMTTMPLTLVAVDGSKRELGGLLVVASKDFVRGELKLTIDSAYVTAMIKPDGTVIETDNTGIDVVHTR